MFNQHSKSGETDAVTRVMDVFPYADSVIVSALLTHADALQRYLAQANHLTPTEVRELLAAFVPGTHTSAEMRATA